MYLLRDGFFRQIFKQRMLPFAHGRIYHHFLHGVRRRILEHHLGRRDGLIYFIEEFRKRRINFVFSRIIKMEFCLCKLFCNIFKHLPLCGLWIRAAKKRCK